MKKYILSILLILLLNVSSCGLVLQYKNINQTKTDKINYVVLGTDVIFGGTISILANLPLYYTGIYLIVPLTIDYAIGTLFYTKEQYDAKPKGILDVITDR